MKIAKTNIRSKIKFYLWLVSIGADVKNFNPDNVEIHELPIKQKSSFKKRAAEIKEKYNHVFKFREQNIFKDYPNIENITFNRKIA